jgi:hypothetical protein
VIRDEETLEDRVLLFFFVIIGFASVFSRTPPVKKNCGMHFTKSRQSFTPTQRLGVKKKLCPCSCVPFDAMLGLPETLLGKKENRDLSCGKSCCLILCKICKKSEMILDTINLLSNVNTLEALGEEYFCRYILSIIIDFTQTA